MIRMGSPYLNMARRIVWLPPYSPGRQEIEHPHGSASFKQVEYAGPGHILY